MMIDVVRYTTDAHCIRHYHTYHLIRYMPPEVVVGAAVCADAAHAAATLRQGLPSPPSAHAPIDTSLLPYYTPDMTGIMIPYGWAGQAQGGYGGIGAGGSFEGLPGGLAGVSGPSYGTGGSSPISSALFVPKKSFQSNDFFQNMSDTVLHSQLDTLMMLPEMAGGMPVTVMSFVPLDQTNMSSRPIDEPASWAIMLPLAGFVLLARWIFRR